jgi:hypothetical protein
MAGTKMLSPGFNAGFEWVGLISASSITRLADDPELTIVKNLTPRYSAIFDSKFNTSDPIVKLPEFNTLTAAAISISRSPADASGIRVT